MTGGSYHSVALMASGSVEDWGLNDSGQLGNLTTTSSSLPVVANGLSGMNAVAGGGYHSLAASAIHRRLTTSYSYDRLYRLLGDGTASYTYDPVGNWLNVTQGGGPTSYTADRADRLTAIGALSVTTNADGNLTAITGSGVNDSFTYDQANRLTQAVVPPTTITYAYDGDGNRTSTTTGGVVTTYVNDVSGGLAVLLSDGARKYVWGPAGLAYSVDSGGGVLVSHDDGLGSVRALTNASGSVVQTQQFDSFGNPVANGTLGTSSQPYGYAGEQADAIGLVYLRARYYVPGLGRFMSRDPAAGSMTAPQTLNRYSYAGNNPVSATDPSGLRTYFIGGIGGSGDPLLAQFVQRLGRRLKDVRGPVSAYDAPGTQYSPGLVFRRGLDPSQDTDAMAIASRVKRDLLRHPLADGEQLNFVALSGGATTAFNAALFLQSEGIGLDNIATIGDVVFRGKPGNVGTWTDIVGAADFVDDISGLFPDKEYILLGVGHVTSGRLQGELDAGVQDTVVWAIVDAGLR